jgi:hypothetical protein
MIGDPEKLSPEQMRQALSQACIGELNGRMHFDFAGYVFSVAMSDVPGLYSYCHPEDVTIRPDTKKRQKT